MKLELNEDQILKDAQQTSAYIGCNDPDHPENYTLVTATDSDRPLLKRFFSEGFAEICNSLKHVLSEVVRHGSKIFLYLTLKRLNRIPRSTLVAAFSGYLVDTVLSRWFGIVSPERAEAYRASAADRLSLITQLTAPSPTTRATSPL